MMDRCAKHELRRIGRRRRVVEKCQGNPLRSSKFLQAMAIDRMAQTSLNQNGFSPSIARAGGTLAGGLSSGMIKGNSLRDALISSGIAAGGSLIGSNYGKEGKGLYDAATKLAMNQYRASQSPVRRVAPMQPRPMISQQPSGPSKQQIMAAMNQMTPAQRQALMARMRGA